MTIRCSRPRRQTSRVERPRLLLLRYCAAERTRCPGHPAVTAHKRSLPPLASPSPGSRCYPAPASPVHCRAPPCRRRLAQPLRLQRVCICAEPRSRCFAPSPGLPRPPLDVLSCLVRTGDECLSRRYMHGLGGTVDTDPLASGAGPSYAADQPLSIAPSSLFDSHPGSTAGDSHNHYPAPGPSRHAFVLPLSVPPFHAEPRDHRPSLGAAVESSRWSANVSHVSQPLPHLQPAHMTDFASPSCGYPEGYAAPLPVASTSASFGTGNGSTRIRLDQHTVNDEVCLCLCTATARRQPLTATRSGGSTLEDTDCVGFRKALHFQALPPPLAPRLVPGLRRVGR